MELRKSYRGFVIWMLLFVAGLVGMMLLPVEDGGLLARGIIVYTAAALALLIFTAFMQLMGWPWWIDNVVGTVGLCAAAFCTMPIKL